MSVIAAPRRTNSIVLSRHWRQTFGNKFRLVVSSDLRSQRQCGKTKLRELNGATSTLAAECSSFEIGRIPERRRATTSEFLCCRGGDASYPAPPARIRTCTFMHTAPISGA